MPFFEFAEMQQQLDGAVSKQALAMIHAQWKPYKAALKDLIASAKAATSRLEGALSRAAELSKRQASSALTVAAGSSAGSAGNTGKKLKVSKGGGVRRTFLRWPRRLAAPRSPFSIASWTLVPQVPSCSLAVARTESRGESGPMPIGR